MAENTRLAARRSDGALRRLDPFEVLNTLRDEMDRFWRDPLRIGSLVFPFGSVTTSAADFMPRVDVYEKDNTIVVTAELPGLTKDDVQVELDDDALVIRGKSQAKREVKEEAYYRAERSFGAFYRRLPLSFEVQPEQIRASMTDGVLEVRIPRPVETATEPTKIPVTSSESVDGASKDTPATNVAPGMEAAMPMEVHDNAET
jgi:HSP20 family protein